MKILILANSKFSGGASGGDKIYESFKKYWPCEFIEDNCNYEYSPFALCYLQRIILSIMRSLLDRRDFDLVYSSSDFLPDSIPGFIYKLKGKRWIAGFFLKAFKENPIHFWTQKVVRWLINCFADMVIVTNPTMYDIFPDKKKTWINGGIDLELAGLSDKPKKYDAVFCGRIHPSKGIDELLKVWKLIIGLKPDAKLAIIGDGDLGLNYIRYHKDFSKGIDLLGYMGDERYKIYKQSKIVIYPTPLKFDHFSMAPVEAMACGCPLIANDIPSVKWFKDNFGMPVFDFTLNSFDGKFQYASEMTYEWAKQFDYKTQAMRVYNDIAKEMYAYPDNWFKGNGGKFSLPSFKRSRPLNAI